jgi:hypothetical protein
MGSSRLRLVTGGDKDAGYGDKRSVVAAPLSAELHSATTASSSRESPLRLPRVVNEASATSWLSWLRGRTHSGRLSPPALPVDFSQVRCWSAA